jgi:flagellar protein FliO/FliZ
VASWQVVNRYASPAAGGVASNDRETTPNRAATLAPTMSPMTTYIVETFLTLLGVVVLAVLVLYAARRLGVGRPVGPLEVLGRLPLDGRRAVYLVRVGRTAFVVGASERGLSRLGELDAATLSSRAAPAGRDVAPDLSPESSNALGQASTAAQPGRSATTGATPPSFAEVMGPRRMSGPEGVQGGSPGA